MTQTKDHVSDLDRHVQQLEAKVNKLRASLTHWQQWYIDYSALKEEVENLPKDPPPVEQLRRIRRDFDGTVLSKKELNEIIGKNDLRSTDHIINLLSRRIDYVEQNIGSLRKLLEAEQNRLAAAAVVARPDAGTDEETGLPLTDIIEELDEEGNVVNFRLQTAADAEPKIVEALKKVGIEEKDLPEGRGQDKSKDESDDEDEEEDGKEQGKRDEPTPPSSDSSSASPVVQAPPAEPSKDFASVEPSPPKKSVSFTEDTKPGHEPLDSAASRQAQRIQELMQKAKEQEAMDMSTAVIPDNESPEESQLRREMLEYSMSEIGPVVAELELVDSDEDDDEDPMSWAGIEDDDESQYDPTDDDDDEDELGRSKKSVITPAYIKRMQELEKRLASQGAFAVGGSKAQATQSVPEKKKTKPDEGIARVSVVKDSPAPAPPPASTATAKAAEPSKPKSAPKQKKSVSFASKLDIAPDPAPRPPPVVKPEERKITHVGDVVEKSTPDEDEGVLPPEDPEEPPKRVSRFKKDHLPSKAAAAARAGLPPGPHQLPANITVAGAAPPAPVCEANPPPDTMLAPKIVEKDTSLLEQQPAVEPDEMDEDEMYREAAAEYARLRDRLIKKQTGGVVQMPDRVIDPETGQVPLDEELGGPKRMSKFKAARLAKLQS
ncbi:hypothetical protein VTJ04DRAFT_3258 [Mycothermus thermophilus]|uniref:uncharacterized protein n=1 Tax=Humicola insolens TaxID=85995 RepID=UPI00374254B9